jgi:hypothetical protein
MLRAGLVFAFIVLTCEALFSQSAGGTSATTCGFSEIYRPSGWRIPGVVGSSEKIMKSKEIELPGILPPPQQRVARASLSNIPGVFATQMQPGNSDLKIPLPYCSPDYPGRLISDESKPVRVLQLWRFDFNGKVFAYGIEYTPATNPPILAFGQVLFYDLDGTGTFTVARIPKVYFFAAVEVPKWAKEGASGTGR